MHAAAAVSHVAFALLLLGMTCAGTEWVSYTTP